MLTAKSRPICPSCSKPATICLCNRLPTPLLNNSVSVTIFQHTLEKNHPLNSARIAKIGLKNVGIVTVSDVNFDAHFFIRPLHQFCAFDFTIAKSGTITSPVSNMSFDKLLASGGAVDEIRKGFVVKKVKLCDEFEITVPCGSVLLYPSESSVDAETIDWEVKNLIVLDGTWAKAKRMYKENPWLRLLPHIRLDLDKVSLYNEVRTQPRAGYLSTIESIVYAMKTVGEEEDADGLDGLLAVFQSMVEDQRRCKDERISKPNS
ncbi:hypothetical protein AAHA92_02670 [Salvia divinorum]